MVGTLRRRFQECQQASAPLSTWRELQQAILEAAKDLQRRSAEQEIAARIEQTGESRMALWAMLGDAFWFERDLNRLQCMIEEVIVELENHAPSLTEPS